GHPACPDGHTRTGSAGVAVAVGAVDVGVGAVDVGVRVAVGVGAVDVGVGVRVAVRVAVGVGAVDTGVGVVGVPVAVGGTTLNERWSSAAAAPVGARSQDAAIRRTVVDGLVMSSTTACPACQLASFTCA